MARYTASIIFSFVSNRNTLISFIIDQSWPNLNAQKSLYINIIISRLLQATVFRNINNYGEGIIWFIIIIYLFIYEFTVEQNDRNIKQGHFFVGSRFPFNLGSTRENFYKKISY